MQINKYHIQNTIIHNTQIQIRHSKIQKCRHTNTNIQIQTHATIRNHKHVKMIIPATHKKQNTTIKYIIQQSKYKRIKPQNSYHQNKNCKIQYTISKQEEHQKANIQKYKYPKYTNTNMRQYKIKHI